MSALCCNVRLLYQYIDLDTWTCYLSPLIGCRLYVTVELIELQLYASAY